MDGLRQYSVRAFQEDDVPGLFKTQAKTSGSSGGAAVAGPSPAAQLAEFLRLHGKAGLTPLSTDLRVAPGEVVFAQLPVSLQAWAPGGDGTYMHNGGIPLSPIGAAIRVGRAVGNAKRKADAARDAQYAWREVDSGVLYVLDGRLVMRLAQRFDEISYPTIMDLQFDGNGIQVHMSGRDVIRLGVPAPDYHYVMLHFLRFDEAVLPPAAY